MARKTRDQLLDVALKQFADKGFYGASIATIADELSLTKQALLHHFGSKEKLYGEVLQSISVLLSEAMQSVSEEARPADQHFEALLLAQYDALSSYPDAARLIMRELLDNEKRAERAGTWYLQSFLDQLIESLQAVPAMNKLTRGQALSVVYQLLGAAHYFVVSQPTLTNMFGEKTFASSKACYRQQLSLLIQVRIS